MNILTIYLIAISLITFAIFGVDKYKAVRKLWRVPEAVLLGLCFIGGSLGGLIGMLVFRHKTRKAKFKLGVPVMLVAQIALIVYLKLCGTL